MLLLANLAVTLALVGLIWTIQLVHYPLFAAVGPREFPALHAEHNRRITPLVAPLMVAELVLAFLLVLDPPSAVSPPLAWAAAACAAGTWVSTFSLSVPLHGRLASGFDAEAVARLVRTNWPRTVLWTARAGLLLVAVGT